MRCLRDTWSDGTAFRTFKTSQAPERLHRACQEVVNPGGSGLREDTVSGFPDDFHPAERRVSQALVGCAQRVVPDDALRLAERATGPQWPVHLKMRAVDRVTESVEKRDIALKRVDGPLPLYALCKGERDVLLVALLLGVLREKRLVHHGHHERRVELSSDQILTRPLSRTLLGLGLSFPCGLRAGPGENIRDGHRVLGCPRRESGVRGCGEQRARCGER